MALHHLACAYGTLQANWGIAKDKPVLTIRFDREAVHDDYRTWSLRDGAVPGVDVGENRHEQWQGPGWPETWV